MVLRLHTFVIIHLLRNVNNTYSADFVALTSRYYRETEKRKQRRNRKKKTEKREREKRKEKREKRKEKREKRKEEIQLIDGT